MQKKLFECEHFISGALQQLTLGIQGWKESDPPIWVVATHTAKQIQV